MQIEVVGVHLDVTSSLAQYVKHRIELCLDRFEDRVLGVRVRLQDISGPHGPGTKRCHIEVKLLHRDSVIVEQDHTDIYTAVDKTGTRLKRTVRRHINRVRDARRSHHRESLRAAWV
jgi:ribosome hibernation promoting factor